MITICTFPDEPNYLLAQETLKRCSIDHSIKLKIVQHFANDENNKLEYATLQINENVDYKYVLGLLELARVKFTQIENLELAFNGPIDLEKKKLVEELNKKSRWNRILIGISIVLACGLLLQKYITHKRIIAEENADVFNSKWSHDYEILHINWKKTAKKSARHYDRDFNGVFELTEMFDLQGKLTSTYYDENQNGIIEKDINVLKDRIGSVLNFDLNEDCYIDSIVIFDESTFNRCLSDSDFDGKWDWYYHVNNESEIIKKVSYYDGSMKIFE